MIIHSTRCAAGNRRTVLIAQCAAWAALGAIIVVTFVPPDLRPMSNLPHSLEHFAAFLVVGAAFAVGYPRQKLTIAIAAVPAAAILELLQLCAAGRHARLSDFVLNALGACAGVAVTALHARRRHHRLASSRIRRA